MQYIAMMIKIIGNFIKNNQYYSCVLTAGHLADKELYDGINMGIKQV